MREIGCGSGGCNYNGESNSERKRDFNQEVGCGDRELVHGENLFYEGVNPKPGLVQATHTSVTGAGAERTPPPPPPKFTRSQQVRAICVLLMQGIGIIALICEGYIFYRDYEWNRVLKGASTVSFPTKESTWSKKYVSFGNEDEQLRKLLRRDVILPVVCMIIVALLLILNCVTTTFDLGCRYRYLSCAAGVYAFLGSSLMTAAAIQIGLTQEYITNVYGTVRKTLTNEVPLDADYVPEELPDGDPISVKDNAEFFLQVFESCRNGDVRQWIRTSELMGLTSDKYLKIPSYHQLVQMGFCINTKIVAVPMIILMMLTVLSLVNVVLCFQIWRKYIFSLNGAQPFALSKKKVKRNAVAVIPVVIAPTTVL